MYSGDYNGSDGDDDGAGRSGDVWRPLAGGVGCCVVLIMQRDRLISPVIQCAGLQPVKYGSPSRPRLSPFSLSFSPFHVSSFLLLLQFLLFGPCFFYYLLDVQIILLYFSLFIFLFCILSPLWFFFILTLILCIIPSIHSIVNVLPSYSTFQHSANNSLR